MSPLERFRVAARLTYQTLGTMLGVDKGRAFQWCHGVRIIPAERAREIARITGLHPSDVRPDLYDPPEISPGAVLAESVVGPVLPTPKPRRRRPAVKPTVAAE